jgi:hypothetical protein
MTPGQRHQRAKLERERSLLQEFALYLRTLDRRTYVKVWGAPGATRTEISRQIVSVKRQIERLAERENAP